LAGGHVYVVVHAYGGRQATLRHIWGEL